MAEPKTFPIGRVRPQGSGTDIQLASTFLEVVATGSFGAAAQILGISQAAVSMRIQALELQLGCSLFNRGRGGARLTAAGARFRRHALIMKQVWDQALLEVALPSGFGDQVRVGGHHSLWRHMLLRWLAWMRTEGSGLALRTEVHGSETLMQLLDSGMLDVAVLFDPQKLEGFVIEWLFTEPLRLVATSPDSAGPADPGYVFVDWGPAFQRFHIAAFPDLALPGLQTNLGAFAVEHILDAGGAGYFPEPVVRTHVDDRRLHYVAGAPSYDTPIYAVYREHQADGAISTALRGLRAVVDAGRK
jgi:LysR family transcriptional regulator, flagellar master operon regulator